MVELLIISTQHSSSSAPGGRIRQYTCMSYQQIYTFCTQAKSNNTVVSFEIGIIKQRDYSYRICASKAFIVDRILALAYLSV